MHIQQLWSYSLISFIPTYDIPKMRLWLAEVVVKRLWEAEEIVPWKKASYLSMGSELNDTFRNYFKRKKHFSVISNRTIVYSFWMVSRQRFFGWCQVQRFRIYWKWHIKKPKAITRYISKQESSGYFFCEIP